MIFTAPAYDAVAARRQRHAYGPYNTYLFYDRNFHDSGNGGGAGTGGMVTEIRVYQSRPARPGRLPDIAERLSEDTS